MPIEIRELHIRVAVASSGESGKSGGVPASPGAAAPGSDKDGIVAECIEMVMKILHDKRER